MWYSRDKNALSMHGNVYFNLQHYQGTDPIVSTYTENKSVHLYFVEFLITRISITFLFPFTLELNMIFFIMTINLCKSVVKEPSYLIFSIHTNFLTCNKTELNAGCSFRCILKLQKFIRKQKNRDASKIAFYSFSKQFAEIFIISKCKNFLYNMAIK